MERLDPASGHAGVRHMAAAFAVEPAKGILLSCSGQVQGKRNVTRGFVWLRAEGFEALGRRF